MRLAFRAPTTAPRPSESRFSTSGLRHPIYSGFILAFWATPHMTAGHLPLAAGMTGYTLIAIRHEERDLVWLFGTQYQEYRRRAGMLIPRFGRGG